MGYSSSGYSLLFCSGFHPHISTLSETTSHLILYFAVRVVPLLQSTVTFEAFKAVTSKITVFWDVTSCSLVVNKRVEEVCLLIFCLEE
jgi:hypothetical protein